MFGVPCHGVQGILAWQEHNDAFDKLALYSYDSRTLTGGTDPIQVFGSPVTEEFFPLLGVKALYGRVFEPEDYAAEATAGVVLSHALWTRHFGADPGKIGQTVLLGGESYTVIGVLPRQVMPLVS